MRWTVLECTLSPFCCVRTLLRAHSYAANIQFSVLSTGMMYWWMPYCLKLDCGLDSFTHPCHVSLCSGRIQGLWGRDFRCKVTQQNENIHREKNSKTNVFSLLNISRPSRFMLYVLGGSRHPDWDVAWTISLCMQLQGYNTGVVIT